MILESKTHKGEMSDMREIWSVEVTFELYLASQKKKNGSVWRKKWEVEILGEWTVNSHSLEMTVSQELGTVGGWSGKEGKWINRPHLPGIEKFPKTWDFQC